MSEKQSPPTQAKTGTSGYLELLRNNLNFRYLWFGEVVSLLGDWFNLIASAALIARLTGSGLAVGGLFVVRMLAIFLISPIAGVWADRYNRRTLIIITDITRAITVMGFLLVRDPNDVWLLYTLNFIQLAISGVFFPAKGAILPDLVSEKELGPANALSSATWSVMLALGAALGGLVAGTWGIYPAFMMDALTFILSAFLVARVQYTPPQDQENTGSIADAMREYMKGLDYLRKHKDILFIVLLKAAMGITSAGPFEVMQVSISQNIFVIGEGGGIGLGIIYTAVGIGSGLGPILARRFTGDDENKLRRAIVWGYLITTVGLGVAATLQSFGLVLVGAVLRSFGSGINWVFSTQLLLMLLPERVRGRVLSTEFAILTLLTAFGYAGAGVLLDRTGLGIGGVLWVASALVLIPGTLWALWVGFRKTNPPETAVAVESQV
ncbi:MAG: MFS transporter [Chloroflexi bacterium]|nr:MAG: MFS transporter [Chloroflexota bacterium]MBL1196293.1 MFS transporter [Chloroflexota bacterium]NOH13588.1 MFS transporter [Chloroflexota bacterium]